MSYVSFNRAKTKEQIEALRNATNGKLYFATDGGVYLGNADGTADLKANMVVVVNDLTTDREDAALSAAQGKILNDTKQERVPAMGSVNRPVYTSRSGTFAECNSYAGGTNVTLNNEPMSGLSVSIYAPTMGGNNGEQFYLRGGGATASPQWQTAQTMNPLKDENLLITSGAVWNECSQKQNIVPKLGSETQPLYTNSDGVFTTCDTYAGGTKTTLNGTARGGLDISIYAPVSAGTDGQLLTSSGTGTAPTWKTYYAPTTVASRGDMFLASDNEGKPVWKAFYPPKTSGDTTGLDDSAAMFLVSGGRDQFPIWKKFYAPMSMGSNDQILTTNGTDFVWSDMSEVVIGTASRLGNSDIGTADTPMYLVGGSPRQGTKYADATSFKKFNGVDANARQFDGFYAPTTGGANGQFLISSGNGAPTWKTYYAPTTAGVNDQLLSWQNGAPTWTDMSEVEIGTAAKLGSDDVGSSTKPIYLDGGSPVEASTYAGGTKVKLNNTDKGAGSAEFYAPTTGGAAGNYLTSGGGTAAPTWSAPADAPARDGTALVRSGGIYSDIHPDQINHGTSDTGQLGDPYLITPNTLHTWGVVQSLYIGFATPSDPNIVNEYNFTFQTVNDEENPTTLSLPASVKWASGSNTARIKNNVAYEVSIVNNYGILKDFIIESPNS